MIPALYKYLAFAGAAIAIVGGAYWYGHSTGYDKRDLEALKAINEQWQAYQQQLSKVTEENRIAREKASESERQAWELYENAQKNYDAAVADGNAWRVRVKSCGATSASVQGSGAGTGVGTKEAETSGELPKDISRNLNERAAYWQRQQEECNAQVNYWIDRYEMEIKSVRVGSAGERR